MLPGNSRAWPRGVRIGKGAALAMVCASGPGPGPRPSGGVWQGVLPGSGRGRRVGSMKNCLASNTSAVEISGLQKGCTAPKLETYTLDSDWSPTYDR